MYVHFDKNKKFIGTASSEGISFGDASTNIVIEQEGEFDVNSNYTTDGKKIIVTKKTDEELKKEEDDNKAVLEEGNLISLRAERNKLLDESDWVVTREREEEGSVSNYADWKTYRQSLRDITKTYKSLDDVKWPTKPGSS